MPRPFEFRPDEARRTVRQKLVHQHMDWGTVRADLVKRTGFSRQETKLFSPCHTFLINLQGEARSGEDFIEGRSVGFNARRPGTLIFIPAQYEWTGWDDGDETGAYLLLTIDPGFTELVFPSEHLAALRPSIGFRSTMIEASLQRVSAELRNPDPISVVMVESQAVQALALLIRSNGMTDTISKGGLSPFDLKTVTRLIESRLSNPPTLNELADAVAVSRRHFSRAFKQSTGKTPYTYLAEYRLKRAVDRLQNGTMSVTDIALECGFSSSSHLTYTFKRALGIRPLEFRRKWRT